MPFLTPQELIQVKRLIQAASGSGGSGVIIADGIDGGTPSSTYTDIVDGGTP